MKMWPQTRQNEAMCDKINGDAAKWDQMQSDFDAIREQFPKPE